MGSPVIGLSYLFSSGNSDRMADKTSLNKSLVMKQNMGSFDRTIRILAAAIFAYLYFSKTVTGILGIILIIFAAVFVVTSFVGYCPLYKVFGLKTNSQKKES